MRLSPVVYPDDVWVSEIRRSLSLTAEAFYEGLIRGVLGVEDLYGHLAVEQSVLAFIDISHSPTCDVRHDVIALGQFRGGFHESQ